MRWHWLAFLLLRLCRLQIAALYDGIIISAMYSELTKTSTALPRLAVLSVLSAARRLILIFVNSLYQKNVSVILQALFSRRRKFCYSLKFPFPISPAPLQFGRALSQKKNGSLEYRKLKQIVAVRPRPMFGLCGRP